MYRYNIFFITFVISLFFMIYFIPLIVYFLILDRNECLRGNHSCHMNASCMNSHGSFECHCNKGFFGNGTTCSGMYFFLWNKYLISCKTVWMFWQCLPCFIDHDECANRNHSCHANATCHNTIGSHNCSCNEGFNGDGLNCTGIKIIRRLFTIPDHFL